MVAVRRSGFRLRARPATEVGAAPGDGHRRPLHRDPSRRATRHRSRVGCCPAPWRSSWLDHPRPELRRSPTCARARRRMSALTRTVTPPAPGHRSVRETRWLRARGRVLRQGRQRRGSDRDAPRVRGDAHRCFGKPDAMRALQYAPWKGTPTDILSSTRFTPSVSSTSIRRALRWSAVSTKPQSPTTPSFTVRLM